MAVYALYEGEEVFSYMRDLFWVGVERNEHKLVVLKHDLPLKHK
jgi:hypothetical protein